MASDDPRPDDNLEQNETSESEPDPSAASDQGLPDDVQQGVDHSVNPGDPAISEDRVREELKQVIDPELFVNIVDLGLIYEVTLEKTDEGPTNVSIDMTLTSPMCPAGPQLIANSKQVLEALEETGEIEVRIVLDPAWSPDRMTDDARDQLGIF